MTYKSMTSDDLEAYALYGNGKLPISRKRWDTVYVTINH